ncbi:ABC transporter-like protein [Leptomonas seymouri]|uniref:ABC transporter-like protein n=1 Tax=Leptomonas seymouri TaxID=5684 RepID=A0A0N1I174_LEPSE|nr:ABC transporter-like protein [Leptomonas seymouri]|eukprot:KPI89823.1 ABC transporter-like protein [Leptomonas seymouri]
MINESTPLVGSSSPLTYTPSYRRWSGDGNERFAHESDARAQRMREYYNSVFTTGGVGMALQNVGVVRCSVFHRRFPTLCPARICCQGVSASFSRGRLHLVTDLDGVAGAALLDAVAGRTACASGNIWIDGVAVEGRDRRHLIASIGKEVLLIPQLSVEDHLWFMVHLHKDERYSWKREMVLAASNFTNLDTHRKIGDLTKMEKFRLQVALELMLDPPAFFFSYSFDSMNLSQQLEAAELLYRLSREIKKTVVLSTRFPPMHMFSVAESLLLFGAGGLVLYSGGCRDAIPYFNRLRIPSNVPEPLWRAVLVPTQEVSTAEGDAGTSRLITPPLTVASLSSSVQRDQTISERRLFVAMCTPPRLSSRLISAHFRDGFAPFLSTPEPGPSSGRVALVEVATCGDLVDLAAEWADSEAQTMYYAAKYYDSSAHVLLLNSLKRDIAHSPPSSVVLASVSPRTAPSSLRKFCLLLLYSIKQITVDAELVTGVVCLSVGLTLVAVLAHLQPEDQGGMYNIRGLIFTAFTLALFTNLVAMDSAGDQLRIAVAHCKRQLYGIGSFIICLSLRIALVRIVYLALFFPFVAFVLKSSYSLALLVWSVGCTHAAFQYVTAAVLPSPWWTVRVWYATFGYNIIFSGFLLNLLIAPSFFSSLSFLRWGYGAVLHTWLHGSKFQCDGINNTSYCYTGDEYLKAQGLENDSVGTASIVLALYSVGLITVLGCILFLKSV